MKRAARKIGNRQCGRLANMDRVGAALRNIDVCPQSLRLRDPIEQMFSYEYLVTGSWSDPIVARRGNEKPMPVADAPIR